MSFSDIQSGLITLQKFDALDLVVMYRALYKSPSIVKLRLKGDVLLA